MIVTNRAHPLFIKISNFELIYTKLGTVVSKVLGKTVTTPWVTNNQTTGITLVETTSTIGKQTVI